MSKLKSSNAKVSVVCPGFLRGDVVGHSAYDYYRALKALGYKNIRAFGTDNDFPDMNFETCETANHLSRTKWFQESDVVIYHYAIYHGLFNVLAKKPRHGKHVICFHNVTPKHLTPEPAWEVIDRSFEQIQLFKFADALWVDSRENAEELKRQGINHTECVEIPIAVDRPAFSTPLEKPRKQIDLLCVGRFFPSKGLIDVVNAVDKVRRKTSNRFVLRFVGNTDFSDPAYITEVKERIQMLGLGEYVDFIGKVDETTLARVFRQSHVLVSASYHEGFCVPVIEGLRAGMVPVTYDAGNLRWIAGGHGRTVRTGEVDALADAIAETIDALMQGSADSQAPTLNLDKHKISLSQFAADARAFAAGFSFEHFSRHLQRAMQSLVAHRR